MIARHKLPQAVSKTSCASCERATTSTAHRASRSSYSHHMGEPSRGTLAESQSSSSSSSSSIVTMRSVRAEAHYCTCRCCFILFGQGNLQYNIEYLTHQSKTGRPQLRCQNGEQSLLSTRKIRGLWGHI